ncbi:MAG: DUF4097 family beta strand repeat protein [Erysipelotrichaceae bacterium]|nr:DUF4097 family beta strand repeat protein [Erysipelotrichaceae bacterium]
MLNEYLNELRKQLELRKVADAGDITAYFAEIIEDRIDSGEDLETILEKLGDPGTVADGFGEKQIGSMSSADEKEIVEMEFAEVGKIDIDTVSYCYEFLPSSDGMFHIRYEKDSVSSLNVSYKHGKVEIEQDYPEFNLGNILQRWINRSKNGFSSPYQAWIYLPADPIADLEIDTVSGNLIFKDVVLGETEINSVSGRVEMDTVELSSLDSDCVSGRMQMNDVDIRDSLECECISGNIAIDRIRCRKISVESVSANVDVSILGRKEDARVRISSLRSSESYDGNGNSSLKIDTVSGKVRYEFLGE